MPFVCDPSLLGARSSAYVRSELIWPASLAIILQSRHDLEVRSLISRMRRLSACAQGAKKSDSKASMSALGWLHQEAGAWQCGAVSRSASGSKHVQGRSASESGHAVSTLDRRARVEHHSASRGGIACHAGRGEGSASGGSFLCVSCAAAASESDSQESHECFRPRGRCMQRHTGIVGAPGAKALVGFL